MTLIIVNCTLFMTMILIYYAQRFLSVSSIYPIILDTHSACDIAVDCLY